MKINLVAHHCLKISCPNQTSKTAKKGTIDHFTVVCLVPWPFYENEAGVDLVLIETSLPSLCKLLLISMRTASST